MRAHFRLSDLIPAELNVEARALHRAIPRQVLVSRQGGPAAKSGRLVPKVWALVTSAVMDAPVRRRVDRSFRRSARTVLVVSHLGEHRESRSVRCTGICNAGSPGNSPILKLLR